MDCRALVNRQLDRILLLIDRLEACSADESRFHLFRELCDRAVLHVLSREKVLLPAWRRAGWREFPIASFAGHVQFKRGLAELLVRPPSAKGFSDALDAFGHQVQHQRILDSDCLIPRLRNAMDVAQRRDLCNDMELLFEPDPAAPDRSPAVTKRPRELVDEAEVVLSCLSARRRDGARDASTAPSPLRGRLPGVPAER